MTTNNTIFTHKEHYLVFRSFWAQSVNAREIEITGAHHMLYNILRGRDYDKGFTPVTRTSKLQNDFIINQGLMDAYRTAERIIQHAKQYGDEPARGTEMEKFLRVFDGSVTPQMLAMVVLPETKAMTADYGPYKKVANFITNMRAEDKPTSFTEIQAILEITQNEAA